MFNKSSETNPTTSFLLEEIITDLFSFFSVFKIKIKLSVDSLSRLENGSSSTSKSGLEINDLSILAFFLCPYDKSDIFFPKIFCKPSAFSISSCNSEDILNPDISEKKFKFSKRTKDNNELYGSIKPRELSKTIESLDKIEIKPSQFDLDKEINKIGSYEAKINLHAEVQAKIHIEVVKQEETN